MMSDIPPAIYHRVCPVCHTSFDTPTYRKQYCSSACQRSAANRRHYERIAPARRKELEPRVCPYCKEDFTPRSVRQIFCSPKCMRKEMNARRRKPEGAPLAPRAFTGYTLGELLFRPFEHILESLNARQLGEAWGVNKDTAAHMKSRPWEYVGTSFEVSDQRERQAREWIRRQIS